MLSSLSAAVTGLDNFQQDMDVIGNNIANINTTGYKDATMQFATSFSNSLASATANPIQIGAGVYDEAITNNWSTGSLNATGNTSDVAINGAGFFVVGTTTGTPTTQYYTQDGAFSVDQSGNLVTAGGQYVEGLTATGALTNIVIAPGSGDPAGSTVSSFTINGQGQVTMTLSTGATSTNVQQLALANFNDPQGLSNQSGNLYSNPLGATNLVGGVPGAPGANGTGLIVDGSLELSNVDLSSEMANLITAQQGFEANSKVVTTSDQLLQTVISMVQA
jgi:flagellar hook protein FlgE